MKAITSIQLLLLGLMLSSCGSCKSCRDEAPVEQPTQQEVQKAKEQAAADQVPAGSVSSLLGRSDLYQISQKAPETWKRLTAKETLTVADVKALSHLNVPDAAVIDQMRCTNCVFYLTTSDIVELRKEGVSPHVINYMLQSHRPQ